MLFPPAIPEGAEYHTSTTVKSIESIALLSLARFFVVWRLWFRALIAKTQALRKGAPHSMPNTISIASANGGIASRKTSPCRQAVYSRMIASVAVECYGWTATSRPRAHEGTG